MIRLVAIMHLLYIQIIGVEMNTPKLSRMRKQGYNVHQASVSAFGRDYDHAVELYYYIKGGRVDYGAAHAAKYGHERYGKTYKGMIPKLGTW